VKQAEAVAERVDGEIEHLFRARTADAKRAIANARRELRDMKREAIAEERAVRSQFAEARLNASKSGR
jgi:hypothetical protein